MILVALLWFVHPHFSGYEKFYSFCVNHFFTPYQEQISGLFHSVHLAYWKFITLTVQYVMFFIDRSIIQLNQIVSFCVEDDA